MPRLTPLAYGACNIYLVTPLAYGACNIYLVKYLVRHIYLRFYQEVTLCNLSFVQREGANKTRNIRLNCRYTFSVSLRLHIEFPELQIGCQMPPV